MPISDISEEEIKDWIKYFENYQAQNISANEQNDDLKFLNRLVDKKIDDEKRKSSKKTIDEEMNKRKKIAKSVNNVPKIKPKDSESEDIGVEKDDYVSDKMMYDVDQYLGVRRTHRRF